MRKIRLSLLLGLGPGPAFAQQLEAMLASDAPGGEGWAGFLDVAFLLNTLLTLTVAAILGAVLAYHPRHLQAADTIEEIEAPKVYILYAVVGAIIGILVVRYSLVVGFVLFGIGGLIRFRTLLRSANLTGRVIFVTLIGLSCGLDLPHVAVISTLFAFVLIYVLEARDTYRVDVQALAPEHVAAAAAAYRELFERHGCRVIAERKNPLKQRVIFLVSGPRGVDRHDLELRIDEGITGHLKGAVDWQTD